MKNFLFALICIVLSACASSGGKPLPLLTFEHLETLPVNVAIVDIQGGPGQSRDDFVISPFFALESYMDQRFRANGETGSLRIILERSSVKHSYESSKRNITRFFEVDGTDIYNVQISIRLEHVSDQGQIYYGTGLNAQRLIKISEHVSLAEREKHQLKGMEEMFRQLDEGIKRIVLRDMRL